MANEKQENETSTIKEIYGDKPLLALLIVIILLGITVRIVYPAEPGLWNDDITTLPTGLLWFYPHNEYPGLLGQGEPALGNLIFGAGCMLSGEDFSGVTNIKPMWYPDRPVYIGKQVAAAEDYCRIPSYLFGFLLFFGAILLAFSLLDKYSSLFFISFFAFNSYILQLSRWIHVDIILYAFIIFGILMLWKFYSSPKYKAKETAYFTASMAFFALAFATKLPSAVYFAFAFLILILKYYYELIPFVKKGFKWLGLAFADRISSLQINSKRFFIMAFLGIAAYILVLLPAFEFNLKNIFLVIEKYKLTDAMQGSNIGSLGFNNSFLTVFHNFLLSLNIPDVALFLLSFYGLFMIIKHLSSLKLRFIFLLTCLSFLMAFIYPATNLLRVFMSFAFGLILLFSLLFSMSSVSFISLFKLRELTKRRIIIGLILFYSLFSFYTIFPLAPYFEYKNPIVCDGIECQLIHSSFAESHLGIFMRDLVNGTDTTFDPLGSSAIVYYYARSAEAEQMFMFRESFRRQFGRTANLQERAFYFKPDNKTIRYALLSFDAEYDDPLIIQLRDNYVPNYKIILKHGFDAFGIYDFANLTKK